jgi:hypothetical protein
MTKTSTLHRLRERARVSPCLTFMDWRGKRSKGIPHPSLGLPEQEWRPSGVALPVETSYRGEGDRRWCPPVLACGEKRARKGDDGVKEKWAHDQKRWEGEKEWAHDVVFTASPWSSRSRQGGTADPQGRHCRPCPGSRVTLKLVPLSSLQIHTMVMVLEQAFIKHFETHNWSFHKFFLDHTSWSNICVLHFKPRYENQVYLAHYAKHKTLTHRGA